MYYWRHPRIGITGVHNTMPRVTGFRKACATFGMAALVSNTTVAVAGAPQATAPPSSSQLTTQQKIALLQQHVKYVFVIFHENESFDHFFGTFPGANGLYAAPAGFTPANQTPNFTQRYLDTSLNQVTASPFLMPQAVQLGGYGTGGPRVPIYPADLISVDHSHQGMANDLDVVNGSNLNDRYAMNQEGLTTASPGSALVKNTGAAPTSVTLAQKQTAETDLSHLDCDTIPFMWSWAKNFVLFDNFHQTTVGPSTPNAIAIIAGQSGETQWALHPNEGPTITYANPAFQNVKGATYAGPAGNSSAYVPVIADPGPFPGSLKDPSAVKPPYNFDENAANPALDLTFATLPLSFMGSNIGETIQADQNPRADLADVQHDVFTIAAKDQPVPWGWYQQGFNGNDAPDPYEPQGTGTPNPTANPSLYTGYVLHHNGPQYFGYLADNTTVLNNNLHGAADFLTAVNNRTLPSSGGVFYLRGGYSNNQGLVPVDPTPGIQHSFIGNDDHPAYSDHQISEAFAAQAISAIANSPYWSQSAIVITYDETDGFYDHEKVVEQSTLSDGSILEGGPRIPTIGISPWSLQGSVSHQYSEHGSLIKFIDELYDLVPLANLPDEVRGRQLGKTNLGQANLGPSDDPTNELGDLTEAFDYTRLANNTPISGALATFSPAQINTLPHLATANFSPNGYTNGACKAIGVLPTDFQSAAAYQAGTPTDPYPLDVNPRPTQSPGTPTSGGWTP